MKKVHFPRLANGGEVGFFAWFFEWSPKRNRIFSVLFLSLLLLSCSARKVEKQTEVSIESNSTSETKKADIETNTRIIETATELIIEPVDPQKESTYNGKTFKNARVKHRKTDTATQTKTTDRSTTKTKSDTKSKVKQKARKSDRTSFNFWWLLLLLIPLFLWLRKRITSPTQPL